MLQDRKSRLTQVRSMMFSIRSDGDDVGSGLASRVGADMRAARERLGWELPAVAAHLRIRLPYLEAIEDGRIDDLPGNAYAVGFLRTYAQSLGLDPDEVARRFREEATHINRKTELEFPAPIPERGVPAGAVVLLGVMLAIGAYAGWYKMTSSGRPDSEPVQPVPPRLMPLAEVPPPVRMAGEAPVEVPKEAPRDTAPVMPSISPSSAAAAIPVAVAPVVPAAVTPPVVAPVIAPDGTRIVLRAKADAWMQVRDRQGNVLLNRVLRAGETWPVPANVGKAALLTTGNAGGTELLVDGLPTGSLGTDGAVRRDLPLDPDQIREGKLAAAPVAVPVAAPKPVVPKPN